MNLNTETILLWKKDFDKDCLREARLLWLSPAPIGKACPEQTAD